MSKAPKFIKSTGGNCGMYALVMALNSVEAELNPSVIETIASNQGISYFGELYSRKQVLNLLGAVKDTGHEFNYEGVQFDTKESFEEAIRETVEAGRYMLVAYYAFQGFVRAPEKVNMDRGHWLVIYDIDSKGNIAAIQSNSKAHLLKALNHVTVQSLYDSNNRLKDVKINWGKYNKCDVKVCKKQLEKNARCGASMCGLNNKMKVYECIYHSDLSNFGIVIYK